MKKISEKESVVAKRTMFPVISSRSVSWAQCGGPGCVCGCGGLCPSAAGECFLRRLSSRARWRWLEARNGKGLWCPYTFHSRWTQDMKLNPEKDSLVKLSPFPHLVLSESLEYSIRSSSRNVFLWLPGPEWTSLCSWVILAASLFLKVPTKKAVALHISERPPHSSLSLQDKTEFSSFTPTPVTAYDKPGH